MDGLTRREFVRGVAAAGLAAGLSAGGDALGGEASPKILNFNERMEYRRLGKTGAMISAISMGGHWKRLPHPFGSDEFRRNRRDVLSACIECGINYVDACTGDEVVAYAEALRGRRDRMYLGYSWYEHEMRFADWQTAEKLLAGFDEGLKKAGLEYVDLWRITCYWQPGRSHSVAHEEAIVSALEKARKAGKARWTGISTHKHDWVIRMMATYPDAIQVVVVPYTAGSMKAHARVDPGGEDWQAVPEKAESAPDSMASVIDAVKKHRAGWFGIKPFASGSVFQSRGTPDSPTKAIDDERARRTLRHILANDALTAPIPGLITVDQVKNAALAATERRALDAAEALRHEENVREMWASLPPEYRWLREEWEFV